MTINDRVRYKPGVGTYGYEESIGPDGRIPGRVVGFTAMRVRVELQLQLGGCPRTKVAVVDAASLVAVEAD
jgi:hypothetical protein